MSRIAAGLRNLADKIAKARGREPIYLIGNYEIDVKYVKPKTTDSRVWENLYRFGNIYLKNKANPLDISQKEKDGEIEGELIASERFKTIMETKVVNEALNTKSTQTETLVKYALAFAALETIAFAAIAISYFAL